MSSSGYARDESTSHRLDRNWAELVQEFRLIGTGIQILFAFLLSIAFQARFSGTTQFQRDVYLATLLASGVAAAFFIAPVAFHRFLFQEQVKDELVWLSNLLAMAGLATLSVAMIGAVLLLCDWVAGALFAAIATSAAALLIAFLWFVIPLWLRERAKSGGSARAQAHDRVSGL